MTVRNGRLDGPGNIATLEKRERGDEQSAA
jgi:hypothetical protein